MNTFRRHSKVVWPVMNDFASKVMRLLIGARIVLSGTHASFVDRNAFMSCESLMGDSGGLGG